MPSLHLTSVPLTQPLVPFPPGSQVQCRKCTALDKVPRKRVGHEDVVLGHGGDARVVADDARQGDLGQGLPLLCAEHVLVFPPKPAREHPQTSYLKLSRTGRTSPGVYCSPDARGPQQTPPLQHRRAPSPQAASGVQTSVDPTHGTKPSCLDAPPQRFPRHQCC